MAGSWFCVAWQPQIRRLDAELSAVGGAAKAGMDDLFAIGPPEVVFPALERFCQDIKDKCLLQLERSKTEVFTWAGVLPAATPEGYKNAGINVGDQFMPGFLCYGIPVGSDGYVRHQLSVKVQEIGREMEMSVKVLENEGHALWTIARSSTAMKLDYHLSLCYPTDMEVAATELDDMLWHMLEKAAGYPIPRVDQGRGVECCPNPPVSRLRGRSYQELSVRTPVRLGGMGYRSIVETSLPAFLGGVEQALTHFTGEGGVCHQLATVLGNMQDSGSRWRDMLASGCRTGEEYTWAWEKLRTEATEACLYLEKEMQGPLEPEVEGAGQGSSDGSTRRNITTWIEDTRAEVVSKAMELLPDQSARPAWVHPQLDKLSQGWILALPDYNGFSQAEFGETVARRL